MKDLQKVALLVGLAGGLVSLYRFGQQAGVFPVRGADGNQHRAEVGGWFDAKGLYHRPS